MEWYIGLTKIMVGGYFDQWQGDNGEYCERIQIIAEREGLTLSIPGEGTLRNSLSPLGFFFSRKLDFKPSFSATRSCYLFGLIDLLQKKSRQSAAQ